MEADREMRLWADYGHALDIYRQLAEIRFKLLAFVPTLSGAAVALLTEATIDRWEKVSLASLGFLVTLGIVIYDQRNTQFYNGAISRAQYIETELELDKFEADRHRGLFGSRKDHRQRHLLLLPVSHGLGLNLVYSPVLGAWAFAALHGWGARAGVAALVGLSVAVLFFLQFSWNDGTPKWLHKSLKARKGRARRG